MRGMSYRSRNSAVRSYVRFINATGSDVRIFWLDYSGSRQLYRNRLGPGQAWDVDTFVTHPWLFEKADTGDGLSANGGPVFLPSSWEEDLARMRRLCPSFRGDRPVRRLVPITYPVYSLRQRSLQAVRDSVTGPQQLGQLEIPESLKNDLALLLKRKICAALHTSPCDCCGAPAPPIPPERGR